MICRDAERVLHTVLSGDEVTERCDSERSIKPRLTEPPLDRECLVPAIVVDVHFDTQTCTQSSWQEKARTDEMVKAVPHLSFGLGSGRPPVRGRPEPIGSRVGSLLVDPW